MNTGKRLDPLIPKLLAVAGWFNIQFHDLKLSEQIFERILKIEENDEFALHCMGRISQENGNLDQAKKYYRRVLEIDPRHISTLINLGVLGVNQGDYESAEEYYQKALKVDSTNYAAIFNSGNLYKYTNDFARAEQYYLRALELQPRNGMAHIALGNVYMKKPGNYSLALEQFKLAAELSPELAEQINQSYIIPLTAQMRQKAEAGK